MNWLVLTLTFLFLTGCQKYYVVIYQQKIGRESLASTYVATPDPRQKNPPKGQELIIEWQIPPEILAQHPSLELYVVYKDFTEGHFSYPVPYKSGYNVYTLTGQDFKDTGGLLSYKAEIVKEDGSVYRCWQHQLWVRVIHFEEEEEETKPEPTPALPVIPESYDQKTSTFYPPDA